MINEISTRFSTYIVGGAVRDEVMGRTPADIDYCVVATQDEFEREFPQLPRVGRSFPVYLNPRCGSEIALTRREISLGDRYQEFDCISGVSLIEDLSRRDSTCNSMAKCLKTGAIIDPFGGQLDIDRKVMRSINPRAFAEDALRILRVCRQAAQFKFDIDPNTENLMRLSASRLKSIPAERVVKELEKAYATCSTPASMFHLLNTVDGLSVLFPELFAALDVPAGPIAHHPEGSLYNHLTNSFNAAKENNYSFSVAIAALCHDFGKLSTPTDVLPSHIDHEVRTTHLEQFMSRMRFDGYTSRLSSSVHKRHMYLHVLERIAKPSKIIRFMMDIRKDTRKDFFAACNCDSPITQEQCRIINAADRATQIKIVLPEHISDTDSITTFVEQERIREYVRLINATSVTSNGN